MHETIRRISETAKELLPQFGGDRGAALREAARRHGVKPSNASDAAVVKYKPLHSTVSDAKSWAEVFRELNTETVSGKVSTVDPNGARPWSEVLRAIEAGA